MAAASLLGALAAGCAPAHDDDVEALAESVGEAMAAAPGYRVVIPHLGDPDVLVLGDTWIVAGSGNHVEIPFFHGNPYAGFEYLTSYDPSALDPQYRYCDVSAPDLLAFDGFYHLMFSAFRVPQGSACPRDTGARRTTYYANAPEGTAELGKAMPLHFGAGAPHSSQAPSCGSSCIRIDASGFVDGESKWLSYNYFDDGNRIASFDLSNPSRVVHNVKPGPGDEHVTEGPEMFKANGKYYLLYSAGNVNGRYHLRYLMADRPEDLTTERGQTYTLTRPAVRASDGYLLQTHGHGTVVAWQGSHYLVNHVSEGAYMGLRDYRHTAFAKLAFRDDGTMVSPTSLDISWDGEPAARLFSFDIVTKGERIGPCVSARYLGNHRSVRFDGYCPDTQRHVPLSEVEKVIICSSHSDPWRPDGRCVERPIRAAREGAMRLKF